MFSVTCGLTAEDRDQLRNPTLVGVHSLPLVLAEFHSISPFMKTCWNFKIQLIASGSTRLLLYSLARDAATIHIFRLLQEIIAVTVNLITTLIQGGVVVALEPSRLVWLVGCSCFWRTGYCSPLAPYRLVWRSAAYVVCDFRQRAVSCDLRGAPVASHLLVALPI